MNLQMIWASFGSATGEMQERLDRLVQGNRGTLTIKAFTADNQPFDLSGATLFGTMVDTSSGVTYLVTGDLTGDDGEFTWELSETDTGLPGTFSVRFRAVIGAVAWQSYAAQLVIEEDPNGTAVFPPHLVGIPAELADWLVAAALAVPDGADVMPKVDPAVAGNLVIQAADGTLSDAGYAADENATPGSVVKRTANNKVVLSSDTPVLGAVLGVSAMSSTPTLAMDAVSTFGTAARSTTTNSAFHHEFGDVSAIERVTGALLFRGVSAAANRAAQRLEILASPLRPAQTDIAGTTHTFALTNEGQILASQSGDPTEFSIPLDSSVAFPVGAIVGAQQQGAGVLTIKAVAGVTLNGVDGGSKAITVQWGAVAIQKLSTNGWTIIGAI